MYEPFASRTTSAASAFPSTRATVCHRSGSSGSAICTKYVGSGGMAPWFSPPLALRLLQRPPGEHLDEMLAVLRAAVVVARRTRSLGCPLGGRGRIRPGRQGLLYPARAQRGRAHVREADVHAAVHLHGADADRGPVL